MSVCVGVTHAVTCMLAMEVSGYMYVCERGHLHVSHGGEWIGAEIEAPELHERGQVAKVREVSKFVVGHVERVEGGGEVVREGGDGREDVAAEAERLLTIYFTMLIDYIANS